MRKDLAAARYGLWRHAARLPARATRHAVTLGEGDTPLVPLPRWGAVHGLDRVYAKLEYANPTGSYKDRGMAVLVALALAAGARHLVEDSSGNAGASAAAYAARCGLDCTVYAPAAAPAAKLRQIAAYGATLVEVAGPRSAVAEAARRHGTQPGVYHVSHNDNPAFVPGNRTFAYEIAEAWAAGAIDGWPAPKGGDDGASGADSRGDAAEHAGAGGGAGRGEQREGDEDGEQPWHVVIPTGGGALLCGAWEGFVELAGDGVHRLTGLPRLHAAQTEACAPLALAWERGLAAPAAVERRPSVCGGIEIEHPARGRAILAAVRRSGGTAVASAEEAILVERDRLARLEGIYAEPTSAAALAGLARLAARGAIGRHEVVVVAVTGSGLKDPGPG